MKARDMLMQRRYAPTPHGHKPRRIARWSETMGGHWRVLIGTASMHRTRSGILYNRRVRLVRRFRFSSFK